MHYHKYVILMRHTEITQDITAPSINQKIEPEKLLSGKRITTKFINTTSQNTM